MNQRYEKLCGESVDGRIHSYGMDTALYEISHENVAVEIIKIEDERYQEGEFKPIDPSKSERGYDGANPPDVVFLNMDQLQRAITDGLLQPLDSFIQDDKDFNIDGIVPIVRDGIREMGNGTLYALAPSFTANALFYNKTFFDQLGVSYPSDNMTWEEVFNLAKELTHEENGEKKYGLSFTGYNYEQNQYYQIANYAAPLGLSMYDEEGKVLTVNTQQWKKAWEVILNAEKSGIVPPPINWDEFYQSGKEEPPFVEHDFISGRAAMAIMSWNEVNTLYQIQNGMYGDASNQIANFEWDVVTVPSHPDAPGVGAGSYLYGFMVINTSAQDPDLAWDYVSFMNGDEVSKVRGKSSWNLVSRGDYIQAPGGLDIHTEAFYSLKPAPYNDDIGIGEHDLGKSHRLECKSTIRY